MMLTITDMTWYDIMTVFVCQSLCQLKEYNMKYDVIKTLTDILVYVSSCLYVLKDGQKEKLSNK